MGIFDDLEDKTARRNGELDADRELRIAQNHAFGKAARILAARECPEDLKAWGERHRIPEFAEFTWQAGFLAGLRMASMTPD